MNIYICQICKKEFEDFKLLHKHIGFNKEHERQTIKQYYEKYYPKANLLTGKKIEFKNRDQYFSSDFNDKNELKKFLKLYPELGRQYAIEFLSKRKEQKELIYAPTYVELKSLLAPSLDYYLENFDYNKECKKLGYKIRFNDLTGNKVKHTDLSADCTLIQDTREQLPLKFNIRTTIQKLDVGDYGLCEKYDQKIYCERKGLSDFVGTIGKDIERFKRELDRAKKSKSYVVMVIEADINKSLSFNFDYRLRFAKVSPSHIFHNLRELIQQYKCFQVLFVDGREDCSRVIIEIFKLGLQAKNIDLQYLYQEGKL